jgi:hypothetical protein
VSLQSLDGAPPFAAAPLKGDHQAPQSPRRTVRVGVRYRAAEVQLVRERARACGVPLARYLRDVSLGAVPRERRHRAADEVIRHLARIGNNLNQLAREAHTCRRLPAEATLNAALGELRRLIRHLATDDDAAGIP